MLIQLALKGFLVALLPLAVVWASKDVDKVRKLAWVTVFLTFDLIMFGAFTRLTDSGLGCPDWPGCYGEANPIQAMEQIRAAEAAMPTGPVTVTKAWIEMIHRYLAMGVGVLIIALLVASWRRWRESARTDLRCAPGLPALLLAWVCVQGAFGAWTVTLKLQPVIVTIHLLLGIGLLCLLVWQASRLSALPSTLAVPHTLRPLAVAALAVTFCQIALGGWVSTNYAALACPDFPLCQGQLVPEVDFEHGFQLWRDLGKTAGGEYLPFAALVGIHWVHRAFAVVVLMMVGATALAVRRQAGFEKLGSAILFVLLLQVVTGASTVFLEWPLALAVIHNGGAALLASLVTVLNFRLFFAGASRSSDWPAQALPANPSA